MPPAVRIPEFVIGLSPFGKPDARLVSAVSRAGGLGVLDLGTGDRAARRALGQLDRWIPGEYGVRVGAGCALTPRDLETLPAGRPHTVLLGVDSAWPVGELGSYYRVLAEVTDRDEASAVVADGADGLVARGSECGGRVGSLSTFVLLQQLLADPGIALPVWACGGIGPHTAPAVVLGGAAGVVLDSQLALLAESGLPEQQRALLAGMDGTETAVAGGVRLLRRRGPGAARPAAASRRTPAGQGLQPDGGAPAGEGARPGSALADEPGAPAGHDLPVGEDGFLAARFAARWADTGSAVRGMRAAVEQAVRGAVTGEGLRPGSPLCAALGTELPLAQGPMTRVSDQPRFAAAVAAAGALPFLALALASGEQARDLLARTRAELGDRPWGVGILGFADERTRAAQLAAVREIGPSHAIVAGGRPAQAADLEAAGIRTYLHVPSAGLLRQFLDAGVRRFVFEGSECGGHTGPMASLPLWEAQFGVLREHGDRIGGDDPLAGVEVLLAGGIHDARSAAMAAVAAAAPAARGAAVGVLMGTAYLFTEEAVTSGAVRPQFQRQVLAAESTALLQTAPGHATRCVPSPFTAEFAAEKRRLRDAGVADREAWEELERLNVGRLRIASKGVERRVGAPNGGELVEVDEERQLAAGMFMAGEVSLLRTRATTLHDLHRDVTAGSASFLRRRAAELRSTLDEAPRPITGPAPLDVAVVGMACMFPQADGLDAYWANVVTGADAVTEVPADRWDPGVYYANGADGKRRDRDTTPSKWGGFLPRIPFDPLMYGIPPASLAHTEPVQLLALEAARRALDDAGYGTRAFDRSRTAVVFGAEAGSDLANATTLRTVLPSYTDVPDTLRARLPELTEDSFPGMLANVIAGRVANRLDLGGANYTVDAACASSLAAVDIACKELAQGDAEMVLCGGADLHNGINDYLLFSSVGALSPTGRCRTFDADADGIALGEGVACVVLKRLADAERDGDRVYAVIKGVGSASDGRAKGLTAPRPEGQRAALERAYTQAGVSPARVGLVEAHGTGTVVGDRTELAVLTEVFAEAGAEAGRCTLGSVKSQIGHTKCAAGLAGLIKAALALHAGVLPPTRGLARPNPGWEETSPFVFRTEARPWAARPEERWAGVSAFGFGGTNFHVVLGAYGAGAPPAHGHDEWPAELLTFRGPDHEAAAREAERLLRSAAAHEAAGAPLRLRDLAATASGRAAARAAHPVRIALVARDVAELREQVRRATTGEPDPAAGVFLAPPSSAGAGHATEDADSARPGARGTGAPDASGAGGGAAGAGAADSGGSAGVEVRSSDVSGGGGLVGEPGGGEVAVLFPGQGSQRVGMAAELLVAFPELQHHLQLGAAHAAALYPPTGFTPDAVERQREALMDTRNAQPALGIAGLATYDLLSRAGVRPGMAGGHSYGELVALCAAGALPPEELPALSRRRAEAILTAAREAAAAASSPGAGRAPRPGAGRGRYSDAGRGGVGGAGTGSGFAVAPAGGDAADAHATPGDATRGDGACDAGAMAAVAAGADEIRAVLDAAGLAGTVVAANLNAPRQTVLSGPTPAVRDAVAALRDAGLGATPLPVACAFHSPLVAAAGEAFAAELADVPVGPTEFPVWANATAAPYPDDPAAVRAGLGAQIGAPVRFAEQIEAMYAAGARVFVEAGPGTVLTALVGKVLAGRPHLAVATEPRPGSGLHGFLEALARLAVAGVPVRTGWLFHGRRTVDADAPPKAAPRWTVDGQLVRDAAGEPVPGGLRPARRIPLEGTVTHTGHGPAPRPEHDGLIAEFLRSSRELVSAQRDVLLAYFGEAPDPAPRQPVAPAAVPETHVTYEPEVPHEEVATEPVTHQPLTEEGVLRSVLDIIGERTGYPADMVEPDLDLEADLSIDSIKRTEIAGELAARLAGTGDGAGTVAADAPSLDDGELEELARCRTAAAIAAWLSARLLRVEQPAADVGATAARPGTDPVPAARADNPPEAGGTSPASGGEHEAVRGVAPVRYVMENRELSPPGGEVRLGGRRVAVLGGGDAGTAMAAALSRAGAEPVPYPGGHVLTEADGPLHGVVHLAALDAGEPVLPDGFPALRAALEAGPGWVLSAAPADAERGAGLPGLFRTAAREYPRTAVRLLQTEGAVDPALLLAELGDPHAGPVVRLDCRGKRSVRHPVERELGLVARAGGGPAGTGAAEVAAVGLDPGAVVVLAGGARGITARTAAALAAASRCRIELLGRTALPHGPEDPATAGAPDRAALRQVLAGRGLPLPEVDRAAGRVLAGREVAATLDELRRLGSPARYHAVDLRDADAVRRTVKEIVAEHGRLDAVVCAAGVIEDRLLAEKDPESFRRVYATKADGARNLLEAAGELSDGPLLAVLFGSVAAVHGNRGQGDYAAANDALDTLGAAWARRTGHRSLTVHWGPWAPAGTHAGMVAPELARDYARRGVQLIDPAEGVHALLRELAWGEPGLTSVVYTASGW